MSHFASDRHHLVTRGIAAQTKLQVTEQPESLHPQEKAICNQDKHAKKQRIMESKPAVLDMATFTYASNGLVPTTADAKHGINDRAPFEEQSPYTHMHVPSTLKPMVLITAFSYERHAGLVPLLPTVPAEASYISVRVCYPL